MNTLSGASELLTLLGDPNRLRLLALLEGEEMSVAELVNVTGVTQSRVSAHLGKLRQAGLVRARRAGTSAMYALERPLPEYAAGFWRLVRAGLDDDVIADDEKRRSVVLAARHGAFPESVAGEMERHYSPGRTWEAFARGIASLLTLGEVLDVGCGDGAVASLIAPGARCLVGLDRSEKMIRAARTRLSRFDNVRLVVGDMHEMPFDESSFDQVALFNVLSYATAPARVLSEARRVLRPGGTVVVQTLHRHAYMETAAQYGHVEPGFHVSALAELLADAGLETTRCEVVARERRAPHFEVLLAVAEKGDASSPLRDSNNGSGIDHE